jgi:hypothetical protein
MKKIVFLLLLLISLGAGAQDVGGYWYGSAYVANASSTNNYLVELILKQNKTAVQAVINYYFKNTFRSIQLDGRYDSKTRELMIFNIPLPYFGSKGEIQVDCPMDFIATHRVALAGSNLTGSFVSREGYKYTCPEITFDLKLNKDASNRDSVLLALKNFKETYQLWSPSARDTFVAATVMQRTIQNPVITRQFEERENDFQNDIIVNSDSLQIDFYDNGEVDGDSISVFFNEKLLGANLKLSTKSVHLDVTLDSTKDVNTLSMFANNLGSIPPNTALMLVYDGTKRYEVRLSSSFKRMVR